MRKISILSLVLAGLFVTSSCDKFLDETPDNRTVVDSHDKVQKLLVNAYPAMYPMVITELASDNVIDQGVNVSLPARFYQQAANWQDITETNNDGISRIWEEGFIAIAHSNLALKSIEKIGGDKKEFEGERAEALITRAYSYFMLANVFCKAYNPETSNTDLGLPFLSEPETELNPKYTRGTLEQLYANINKDIEAALPYIKDNMYKVPQYHFTRKAAYAFAARFNLFYGNFQKAKEYATVALGAKPETVIRDWSAYSNLETYELQEQEFIKDESVFLTNAFTSMAYRVLIFGSMYRYNHTKNWARFTLNSPMPWSGGRGISDAATNAKPLTLIAPRNSKIMFKIPNLFEITNPVAQIGYPKAAAAIFYADETLLVRAEAEVMLKEYDNALADLNLWVSKFYKSPDELTIESIKSFYDGIEYSTDDKPTIKSQLNPVFAVEQGVQESMIQFVLQCRRILTIHEGLRWYDLKRYGIEVRRYQVASDGVTEVFKEKLSAHDPRKAFQVPQEVIASGFEPNPR